MRTPKQSRVTVVVGVAAILMGSACGDDSATASATLSGGGTGGTEAATGTDADTRGTESTTVMTSGVSVADTGSTTDPSATATTTSTTDPTAGSTGGTTTGNTGTDTDTGGEVSPGQPNSQLVSSGTRTFSDNYTLVYTFGQPSQLQSTHQSANYRLQGGLVGANGSPP